MTQRSTERRNTGRRGAAQRKAYDAGKEYGKRMENPLIPFFQIDRLVVQESMKRPPSLAVHFRCGAFDWLAVNPVEF